MRKAMATQNTGIGEQLGGLKHDIEAGRTKAEADALKEALGISIGCPEGRAGAQIRKCPKNPENKDRCPVCQRTATNL